MTNIEQQHLPYAQSFKNFDRMSSAIKIAIDTVLPGHWHRFDSLNFINGALSPETFSARFRDAVRYGVKHGYLNAWFTPQQLVELYGKMEVSMGVEPPFVWVYNKQNRADFLKFLKKTDVAPLSNELTSTATSVATTEYILSINDLSQLYSFLAVKKYISPALVLTVKTTFDLPVDQIDKLQSIHDCSIERLSDKEYLLA
jgi:hypothetical protein